MVKSDKGVKQGPFPEEIFQEKLRAGDIPYYFSLKSNQMKEWQPLLEVVSSDETFRRASTLPPPEEEE